MTTNNHVWEKSFLENGKVGYVCEICLEESIEKEYITECVRASAAQRATRKKNVIIESRYVGSLMYMSWREWHKYGSYENLKSARLALENLRKKDYGRIEYRLKPPKREVETQS